jgi:hypothetical protein
VAHDISRGEMDEREAVDARQHLLETDQAATTVGHVDLSDIAGHDDLGSEPDPGQEHLHLLGRRVLRFVEDDEAVVQRSPAHERERRDFDGSTLEQLLSTLGIDHVVQGVVQRTQVRIDLRHQVAGQESQSFARFDGRTGQNDALDLLRLQRLDRHRDGQPRLAGSGWPDAERDDVGGDGIDVPFLAGGLGTNMPAPGTLEHLMGEDVGRSLVGLHHPDRLGEAAVIELVTALEQRHQLVEQLSEVFGVFSPQRDLVATYTDVGVGEPTFDLAEVLIARTQQRCHQVRSRNNDGGRGVGRRHAHRRPRAALITSHGSACGAVTCATNLEEIPTEP